MITILEIFKKVIFRKKDESEEQDNSENDLQKSSEKAPIAPTVCFVEPKNSLKSADIQDNSKKYMNNLDSYIKQKFAEERKNDEIEKH
jgi:hypothetical protein